MFVKLGKEEHLRALLDKGEMYFNPCKYYREIEHQGIGDKNDGGQTAICESVDIYVRDSVGHVSNVDISWICESCLNTPIFCLMQLDAPQLSADVVEHLKKDFPEYDYALVLNDEDDFLEKVRYNFRSKAFAHKVFYQDNYYTDYFDFLLRGESDVRFYVPHKKAQYYAHIIYDGMNGEKKYLRIDDSNAHKMMYRKGLAFQNQKEYRIVLPYEHIDKGKIYSIGKLANSEIVRIEDIAR